MSKRTFHGFYARYAKPPKGRWSVAALFERRSRTVAYRHALSSVCDVGPIFTVVCDVPKRYKEPPC
jgi:hypothetical protein